jgi:DNA-directed RNA polymerase subunit beta'
VRVRTPLSCETRYGLCAKCYGRDLGRGSLVNAGEAVGVIAAQSIGEPGTQLTMRTFHIGGAASRAAAASAVEAKSAGVIRFTQNMRYVANAKGEKIVISRSAEVVVTDEMGRERERHKIPYGATLSVDEVSPSRPAPSSPPGIRTPVRSSPNTPVSCVRERRRGRDRRQADRRSDRPVHPRRDRCEAPWCSTSKGVRPQVKLLTESARKCVSPAPSTPCPSPSRSAR